MRGAWILGTAALFAAAAVSPVKAQTVTSVEPTILGQATARATQRMSLSGSFGDGRIIADGLTFSVTDDVYGRPSRTYEFDTASNGITTAGAIAVVPPSAAIYDAFTHLANVINSDPNAPFTARYNYDSVIGNNGWYVLVWKYDREYRRTVAPFGPTVTELADPGSDLTINGTFSTNNGDNGPVYLQLQGTGLTALVNASSVKLRHQVNTAELYNGIIVVKHANAATVAFSSLKAGSGSPPTFPSLGVYDVEINGTPSGQTVTLVRNLLDDPTFRVHATGSSLGLQWFSVDILPGTHWMSSPFPGSDIRDNGSANRQLCPRLYPFPTGGTKAAANNNIDFENMSLQWSTAGGVHRAWQTHYVNFVADTTLTLTGLWAATADHYAMSYGAQLRAGDENGTIIAETPPGQQVITPFNWTDFSVSGVFPTGTTQVTVVFYGQHSTTSEKSLHLDDLMLRVDNDHPTPPAITGMTTLNYASIGDTNVAVTLTGLNLTNAQTSVTLRQPDVMPADYFSWADVGKKLVASKNGDQNSAAFGAYKFDTGDKFVVTGAAGTSTAILGEYDIAGKDDDRVITLVQDINGATGDEGATITGYIVKAPLAATSVNATGTEVTATFDLIGVPAGYRNIIVEVGTHDPIVWREGFNVINAGSALINGSFELPTEPPQNCAGPRIELPFSPASDWNVRFWNNFLDPGNLSPIVSFRDDFWNNIIPLPTCPPPERGAHYASSVLYSSKGTGQWYQTLNASPGATYILSGYFGHSGEFGAHGTKITLSLLDGDSTAAPMAGASQDVLTLAAFEDWTFGSVTGTATGNLFTVAWEVECFAPDPGPKAVWIDHLVLEEDICNDPVADADDDGDVDLDDFAVFQICYTGTGGGVPTEPAYCKCFDTEGAGDMPDGDIDEADLVNFANCASGSMVPADINCDD